MECTKHKTNKMEIVSNNIKESLENIDKEYDEIIIYASSLQISQFSDAIYNKSDPMLLLLISDKNVILREKQF